MYEIRPESLKTFITANNIRLPRFQRKQTWDAKKKLLVMSKAMREELKLLLSYKFVFLSLRERVLSKADKNLQTYLNDNYMVMIRYLLNII